MNDAEYDNPMHTRREFLTWAARGAVAAAAVAASAVLIARAYKGGGCPVRACQGCPALASCALPQADQAREKQKER